MAICDHARELCELNQEFSRAGYSDGLLARLMDAQQRWHQSPAFKGEHWNQAGEVEDSFRHLASRMKDASGGAITETVTFGLWSEMQSSPHVEIICAKIYGWDQVWVTYRGWEKFWMTRLATAS